MLQGTHYAESGADLHVSDRKTSTFFTRERNKMKLMEEDFSTLYYIRDEWQTLTVNINEIQEGYDEEYSRKFWDLPILDTDSKLRINSRPFMQILKNEVMEEKNYQDYSWVEIQFKKDGKGRTCTYEVEILDLHDNKQNKL